MIPGVSSMNNDVEVSVVLPTLNEENTIGICIDKILDVFKSNGINGEIIISDSSDDKTPKIAAERGAKVVKSLKKGYGNAYIEGFKHAKGSILVMGDADNTYDFYEIPKFIMPLRENEADFVIGNRFGGGILDGAMPKLHKHIGNPLLTKILNILFGMKISDAHCGLRAFTRKAWESMDLMTGGMEFASEMVIKAAKRGLRIKEVPICLYPRPPGCEAKISSFSDGWRHLRFMLLYQPNLLLYSGLLIFFIGVLFTSILWFGPLQISDRSLHLHPFILFSFINVLGFQILIFGIYTKVYSTIFHMDAPDRLTKLIIKRHSLEKELILGIIIFAVGFLIDVNILLEWINNGFGSLNHIKNAIIASNIMIIGAQIFFSSIFISILLINRHCE